MLYFIFSSQLHISLNLLSQWSDIYSTNCSFSIRVIMRGRVKAEPLASSLCFYALCQAVTMLPSIYTLYKSFPEWVLAVWGHALGVIHLLSRFTRCSIGWQSSGRPAGDALTPGPLTCFALHCFRRYLCRQWDLSSPFVGACGSLLLSLLRGTFSPPYVLLLASLAIRFCTFENSARIK